MAVSASAVTGVAPLRVHLSVSGHPAAYTWDLGDGPGRHLVTVTAKNELGEPAGHARPLCVVVEREPRRGPSVPPYPAPHGCVRVPMWIAPSLDARHGYGTRIVVCT